MTKQMQMWLDQLQPPTGCRACAVRWSDQDWLGRSWDPRLPVEALDPASRYVFNTLRVMTLHRLPTQYHQWTFTGGTLHSLRREDGAIFLVCVSPGSPLPETVLQTWAESFFHPPAA